MPAPPLPAPTVRDAPLLRLDDLRDPARYRTVANVPLLDEHEDEDLKLLQRYLKTHPDDADARTLLGRVRGHVDRDMLERICANNNERVGSGDFPALVFGHTVGAAGTAEAEQPEIGGHATNWRVGDYRGRACIYVDEHHDVNHEDDVKTYPYRSIERLKRKDFADRVALLRKPPERDLGVVKYARLLDDDDGDLAATSPLRVFYSRDLPPLAAAAAHPPTPEASSSPTHEDRMEPSELSGLIEALKGATQTLQDLPAVIGESLHKALSEYEESARAGGAGDRAGYEDGPEMEADEEGPEEEDRAGYAAGEAGNGGAVLPDMACNGKADRKMYARISGKVLSLEDENALLFERILNLEHDKRRANYERAVTALRDDPDSPIDLDEDAFAEEMAELVVGAPADFEERHLTRMRKRYARAGHRPRVAVGAPEVRPQAVMSPTVRNQVVQYAGKKQISFSAALAELKDAGKI